MNERAAAWGLSTALHLLLLGAFALWHVRVPRAPETWLAVTFAPAPAVEAGPVTPSRVRRPAPPRIQGTEPLPEELALRKRMQRLQQEEQTQEKQLFGGKAMGVKIQGRIAHRQLVRYRLPPPVPLLREAEIQVRIEVLPDGTVGSVRLIRRGPPELERLVLESLRTWRFSPLPPGLEGVQDGIVTFTFRLPPGA